MTLTLRHTIVPSSPLLFNLNEHHRQRPRVLVRRVGDNESCESIEISCASSVNKKNAYVDVGGKESGEKLEVFWDDGFGSQTIDDCIETIMSLINNIDKGPPRWFCPIACGKPVKHSPVLLYLPGN